MAGGGAVRGRCGIGASLSSLTQEVGLDRCWQSGEPRWSLAGAEFGGQLLRHRCAVGQGFGDER